MARSSILLKNLTPLVVGNVLGKIFGATIHLTNLPGTSVLAVTSNHNLSTSKFDGLLGEPWVVDKNIFVCYFSAVQPSVRLWALAYATQFLSCLLFSAGFWAAIRLWRPLRARSRHTLLDKTGVAGVHSSWSCEAVDMGLAFDSQTNKLSPRAVVLRCLPDLGLSWTSPVSW